MNLFRRDSMDNSMGLHTLCSELGLYCVYDTTTRSFHFARTSRCRTGTNSLDDKQGFENTMLDLFGPEEEIGFSEEWVRYAGYDALRSLLIKKFFPTV